MMSCEKKDGDRKVSWLIPESTRSLVLQDVSGTVGAPHLRRRNHIREQQTAVSLRDAGRSGSLRLLPNATV